MKDPIVQIGAEVLRHKAKPVAKKDFNSPQLKATVAKMRRVLAKEEFGVAIAAPQIGVPLRLFVIAAKAFETDKKDGEDGTLEQDSLKRTPHQPRHLIRRGPKERAEDATAHEDRNSKDMVFINPEITRLSRKKKEMSEGCLSVRDIYGTVLRHEKASVHAFDISGKPFDYHASGLIAHIFQHECDHLDGILYTDKATRLRKDTKEDTDTENIENEDIEQEHSHED